MKAYLKQKDPWIRIQQKLASFRTPSYCIVDDVRDFGWFLKN